MVFKSEILNLGSEELKRVEGASQELFQHISTKSCQLHRTRTLGIPENQFDPAVWPELAVFIWDVFLSVQGMCFEEFCAKSEKQIWWGELKRKFFCTGFDRPRRSGPFLKNSGPKICHCAS